MNHVLDLIRQHGDLFYLITFIWTALEGETFVIFAALAAHRGLLEIWPLFFCAWAGTFVGDNCFFFLGRKYGHKILEKKPKIKPKLEKIFGWLEKYSAAFILTYRFMYGVRNISAVAIGMSKLSWQRYVFLNFCGAGVWATAFCGAGYFFSEVIAHWGKRKEEMVTWGVREFMLGALALFLIVLGVRYLARQRRLKRQEAERRRQTAADPDDMSEE